MIKVLHKALNILEYVSRTPEGQPLSAIAAAIGEKPTTTSNIVQVLAARNYLERKDGKWKLGIYAYMLTGSVTDYDRSVSRLAEPLLRELAAETMTSAVLSLWRGNERCVLLRVADGSPVTVNREYPEDREVYRTATGIVLLAGQPEPTVEAHIAKNGIPGNPNPTEEERRTFREMLARCNEQGYYARATNQIFETAAPLRDPSGRIRTAVGIFLPLFRTKDQRQLTEALLRTTARLEATLNGTDTL